MKPTVDRAHSPELNVVVNLSIEMSIGILLTKWPRLHVTEGTAGRMKLYCSTYSPAKFKIYSVFRKYWTDYVM